MHDKLVFGYDGPDNTSLGLTAQQYFSILCLQGMLANPNIYPNRRVDEMTSDAIELAEALIAKLP